MHGADRASAAAACRHGQAHRCDAFGAAAGPAPGCRAAAAAGAVAPRPYGRMVTCCWPIGEPGTREFRFCDVPSEPGRPYCEDHVKVAYVKVRDRREDAA